jgi:hypothetical protein
VIPEDFILHQDIGWMMMDHTKKRKYLSLITVLSSGKTCYFNAGAGFKTNQE